MLIVALTLTTKVDIVPVTLGIYTDLGANIANWSAVMATVLASIPAIVLLVVAQKYIATGGAAK